MKNVIGIDISEKMVEIGRQKVRRLGLEKQIDLQEGDSEQMVFEDASFDAVTVAFGVRNFENLEKGLKEIRRVLKPGRQGGDSGIFNACPFSGEAVVYVLFLSYSAICGRTDVGE